MFDEEKKDCAECEAPSEDPSKEGPPQEDGK